MDTLTRNSIQQLLHWSYDVEAHHELGPNVVRQFDPILTTHICNIFPMWDSIFLDSHAYTQQSPPHTWVHHHIATLYAMWVCSHHSLLPLLPRLLFEPVLWTFAPYSTDLYSRNPRLYPFHESLSLTSGPFVYACTFHICPYSKESLFCTTIDSNTTF